VARATGGWVYSAEEMAKIAVRKCLGLPALTAKEALIEAGISPKRARQIVAEDPPPGARPAR
jgi:hypothetical protein